jgi:hypothetical protein
VAVDQQRNLAMAARIGATPVRYPFSFVVAGDSGAWPDPTADAIFAQLVRQVAALEPAPVFFANLGDFAGPGTAVRHEHYLGLVGDLPVLDICVVGNHDLDDARGAEAWASVHGPTNFTFGYGHTRFVAIDATPGSVGEIVVPGAGDPEGTEGPRAEALAFLDRILETADEPHRVVLMQMPPHLGGRFAPHAEWGFQRREGEFLAILRRHGVALVCCAHGLAFDHHVHDGIHFVMSGRRRNGALRGVCSEGDGRPEDRGALFHAVQLVIDESGAVGGRVLQAFEPTPGRARFTFGRT